jgi:hypothetical protein
MGHVPKKCVNRGQTVISCPDGIAPVTFEMLKKLSYKGHLEIFHAQVGRRLLEALCSEAEKEAKCVPVASYCM